MVLSLSLITSLSVLWYSEYPYKESHHSLHIGSVNPFTHHSLPGGSDNPYTHHSLPRGTQTIPLLITVCLVVLRVSLYSLQSPWLMSDYPYTHHSFPRGTQTIPLLIKSALWYSNYPFTITVFLVVLRVSLYSSQSPWRNSDYTYTHYRLPRGTQTISILITVSLVVLRLSLYSSQSA